MHLLNFPLIPVYMSNFSEDRNALNKITDAVRTNFNDRVDEVSELSFL
jgi:hypothetical protein